jgi:hypothetical protein
MFVYSQNSRAPRTPPHLSTVKANDEAEKPQVTQEH